MIICKNAVYLDVQKTGSDFTHKALRQICNNVGYEKHQPNKILRPDRLYYANKRNPWDYYVSMWSYDRRGSKGPLINRLIKAGHSGVQLKKDFNYFVKAMYDDIDYYGQEDYDPLLQHKYWSNFDGFGIQSFRMALFFDLSQAKIKRTNAEARKYFRNHILNRDNVVFLEQEHLAKELQKLILDNSNYFNLKDNYKSFLESLVQRCGDGKWRNLNLNNVTRNDNDYRSFYKYEAYKMVAEREEMMIEEFGYEF